MSEEQPITTPLEVRFTVPVGLEKIPELLVMHITAQAMQQFLPENSLVEVAARVRASNWIKERFGVS